MLPLLIPVTRPPPLIVAKLLLDELHVTVEVKFFELPSLYFPVAVSCWMAPMPSEVIAGVMVIDVNGTGPGDAGTIDSFSEFDIVFSAAVMVTLPLLTPVTRPPLLTFAISAFDELQVALEVRSFELPSLYLPVAFSC